MHQAMKTWGSGSTAPCILNLGTRMRWVANSKSSHCTHGERAPSTQWIGEWVGSRAVWMQWQIENIPALAKNCSPAVPAHSLVTILTDLCYTCLQP